MSNRLAEASSPYLAQHKDNPVEWWEWSDAAFAEARRRDVPIFLSVGYSTCHWCHVMAHESFEDDAVAAALNKEFVCIKVDREERPDLDSVYMAYCQMTTGSGGWPLTVMLDHERRPWFAGTYFPKVGRGGRPGVVELADHLSTAWQTDREKILAAGSHVIAHLEQLPKPGDLPDVPALMTGASNQLASRFDEEHGGFGTAPKFPSPHQILMLLRTGGDAEIRAAGVTISGMIRGGLHDHVGGGFHRYSTDQRWHLPHFEKMLYDQAMMLMALTEYWQATGDEEVHRAAKRLITYLERDLLLPGGAFASAEDADSAPPDNPAGHQEEGLFYIWSAEELRTILGNDAAGFMDGFDCKASGNFNDESTGQPDPRNILHARRDPSDDDALLDALLNVRSRRPRPLRDDKILADWNGLMIAALSKASVLDQRATHLAQGAATFIRQSMMIEGTLRHRSHLGKVDDKAFLDDHAFVAWGFLELWQATQHPDWLVAARSAAEDLFALQSETGALWPAHPADDVIARRIDGYDGAAPSGNSIAAMVAAKWWRLTGDTLWQERAAGIGRAFSEHLSRAPSAFCAMISGLSNLEGQDIVIPAEGDEWWQAASTGFAPDRLVVRRTEGIQEMMPWLSEQPLGAIVCQNHACSAPLRTPEELRAFLLT